MSLIVSSSRYYCPGPGQVQYESCPQCSFINVQWHVVVFIIFWTLLYYEKDIMRKESVGIANMSPIPKVIIPSFSWIIWFFVVFRDTLILPRLYPPRRLSPTTPTPWGCRRCPWPHPLSASRHPSPSPV